MSNLEIAVYIAVARCEFHRVVAITQPDAERLTNPALQIKCSVIQRTLIAVKIRTKYLKFRVECQLFA